MSVEMVSVRVESRVFPSGFDIATPGEKLLAKEVLFSPRSEIRVINASGTQIARLERESFFRNSYTFIITGGEFYQFSRDQKLRRNWLCKGEGRLLRVSEHRRRRFSICDEAVQIAVCSKSWYFNDYSIDIFNETDTTLLICTIMALSLCEHQREAMLVD